MSSLRKPRRTIVITSQLDDAIKRLSIATGASYSSIIVDFLSPCAPTINLMAQTIENVKLGVVEKSEAISLLDNVFQGAKRSFDSLSHELGESDD